MIKSIQEIKKRRQGTGKRSKHIRGAPQTKHPEQHWTANPCQYHWSIQGSPVNAWYQRIPWTVVYFVLNSGDNIWKLLPHNGKSSHLHLHRRHSALCMLLVSPPELSGSVQMRMQLEKTRNTWSDLLFWSVAVCRAELFLAIHTKCNLDLPQFF